jgi:hypothetical protein
MRRIMTFVDKPLAATIEPDKDVPLHKVPSASRVAFEQGFFCTGFDVIDISGLSGVSSIGYSPQEAAEIRKMNIDINQYGLIQSLADANKFADFASDAAEEHAPFEPAQIWCGKA